MLTLAVTDGMIDPRVFYLTGTAMLMWPKAAEQPSAVVTTKRGVFTTTLRDAPESLRGVIGQGNYAARYVPGYVTVA